MNDRNNTWFPFAVSALAGLVVCLAIVMATGRSEAWDSPVYFSVGIPVMCLSVFAVSYLFPVRAWRWTVSMAFGQSVAMLLGGNSLSLWPLAIVAMTILSVPQLAAHKQGQTTVSGTVPYSHANPNTPRPE